MSYKKFKFISPGIFINEIDNSQLPRLPAEIGPAVIGRLAQGPALKPVQVNSFEEFINIFGNPIPGGKGGDVFRYGNYTAPTYAAYAAQAWLKNNSPITVVRLLGQTNNVATSGAGLAGWSTTNVAADDTYADNGGAYGLFICEGGDAALTGAMHGVSGLSSWTPNKAVTLTGTLAAVWYVNNGALALSGAISNTGSTSDFVGGVNHFTASLGTFIEAVDTGPTFKVVIYDATSNDIVIDTAFNFDKDSPKFIRKVFNTNPILTNSDLVPTADTTLNYWLGESYEGWLLRGFEHEGLTGISGSVSSNCHGIVMRLATPDGTTNDGADFRMSSTKSPSMQFAKTGWFFSQDTTGDTGSYNADYMQKLFRFAARELGEETQRKVKISIRNIKPSNPMDPNKYGSFDVLIRDLTDRDSDTRIIEQYNNCNLNPSSDDYIAKKVGDKFLKWDDTDRRYRSLGDYENRSDYIYIVMNELVDAGNTNEEYLPYGVYGPPRYKGWAISGTADQGGILTDYEWSGALTTTGTFVESGSVSPFTNPLGIEGTFHTGSQWLSGTGDTPLSVTGTMVMARYKFPALRLRTNSSEGSINDPRDAYWGVDPTYNSSRFDASTYELLRTKPEDLDSWDAVTDKTEISWVCSLDDVRNVNITSKFDSSSYGGGATYESGSRVGGYSYTAHTASGDLSATGDVAGPSAVSWQNVIKNK